ncbi:penicillin-binding protein 2 [Undibacterium fentianense]|uniref:Peptidoglycan D,D-transpeptidase MrdA n=1 Tax=Undibacterium fentianense TaxID=2828728 RepID=A0A941E5V5_9BURK|nr:penicillin-binding protein 2 [Undibacterium fentianense]MBR7801506.1 penicillin-binding protein 2 [Undibacterium fentianense]
MTELKNTERELYLFRVRLVVIGLLAMVCFTVLLGRYVWLQIVKHEAYATKANENRISVVPIVPNRGLIMDRNGVILARNYSAYTLEITPSKITQDLDSLIDDLSTLVDIQPKHRKRLRKLMDESKSFGSLPIRTRLSDEEVARFTAQRFRFPGVDVQARLFRQYPLGDVASHVIGYIGRINKRDAELIEDSEDAPNYKGTNYIGKEGLEKSYEKLLHGTTGFEEVEVSAGGRPVRTLSRNLPASGKNLILSVDIELQKVVEEAFGDRRGALVAIEPSTGDVLSFVSMPTFDPNLFVEGIDQQSWNELNTSEDIPLLNRPLTGAYPPGSTFKPFMALAALELGKRTMTQAISDPGYFAFGNKIFRDDRVGGHGFVDMYRAVALSCDTYFYQLANDMGVDAIHDFMAQFGMGQITGIDLDNERRGLLPSTEWKRTAFKKTINQRWIPGDTISLGIGQGQNTFTPLQMAHATATLVNNGIVMKPHLVKQVEDPQTKQRTLTVPKESNRISLKPENVEFIKNAMAGVVKEGTGARAFAGAEYTSGGKTGTAQVVAMKKTEKHGTKHAVERFRDHSWYIAFAPVDKPRIAIAIIVENGGYGAESAAPIVRKAIDYYLLGKRPADKTLALSVTKVVDPNNENDEELSEEEAMKVVPNTEVNSANNANNVSDKNGSKVPAPTTNKLDSNVEKKTLTKPETGEKPVRVQPTAVKKTNG